MNEIIAALMIVASTMAKVPAPDVPPVVVAEEAAVIQQKACGGKCPNLYFWTDPLTDKIYYTKGVNFEFTLAKAELLHELARYVLAKNGIYKKDNTCERNTEIEAALSNMKYDFLMRQLATGKYVGAGIPTPFQMPKHIFYCKAVKGVML